MDKGNSLEIAINNEMREKEFYLKEAARSTNPIVGRLMNTLAKEEEEHAALFRTVHQKMIDRGSWPEDVSHEGVDSKVEEILAGLDYKADVSRAHDNDDVTALRRAIDFEKEAAQFYSELAKDADTPRAQAFWAFLSSIERRHQLSIEDSLSYLEDPQQWLMGRERAGLDGA